MKVQIETIPHDKQRYPTVGDWQWQDDDTLSIRVSELGDWRYNALVALHELVEVLLCKHDGVTEIEVDAFDMEYEKQRDPKDESSEPGDDVNAPYRKQHCVATGVERIVAAGLGVAWNEYADKIESLP